MIRVLLVEDEPGFAERFAGIVRSDPEFELIGGSAGTLEIAHMGAPDGAVPRGVAVIAHPHPLMGGTMDNKVAVTLAKTFHQLGYATVRFNFRGVGRSAGTFDEGIG